MPFFCRTHIWIRRGVCLIKKFVNYAAKYAIPNPYSCIRNKPRKYACVFSKKLKQAVGGTDTCKKRAVPSASFKHCQTGSLTVEAALALPVCLGALFLMMGLFQAMAVCEQVNVHLCTAARSLAAYHEAGDGYGTADAYRAFYACMGDSRIDSGLIRGGYGGILLGLEEDEQDEGLLRLKASYQIKIPGYFVGSRNLSVSDTVCIRAWIGGIPDNRHEDANAAEHTCVYVAENGVVYHTSESCTYLRLSVRQVGSASVESLRNRYGARYIPCERCGQVSGSGTVYITDQGRAWHTDSQCSGLKRNMHLLDKETAIHQGLRPCTRCGG